MMKGVAGLGVRRKKTKRPRSKGFARAVADYLVSDSYMYAPLLASPPLPTEPSPPPPATLHTPPRSEKGVSVVQLRRLLVNECSSPLSR